MKHQESELFFRYHRGLCTKAEKDEVEKLLNGSEAYRLQFLDSKIAWALGEDIKLMEAVDAELGYKKIKADIRAKKIRIFQERKRHLVRSGRLRTGTSRSPKYHTN